MFGLMKNAGKETDPSSETVKLTELEKGYGVGFGFMPQKNLSGKRLPVTGISSYLFERDNFTAYHLENDEAEINLIVAEEEEQSDTYLALSQRIEPRLYNALFSVPPHQWFAVEKGGALTARPEALSAPQGWLAADYTLALAAQGRFMQGDYRSSESAERIRQSRPCDYVLFVSGDFAYALEAEKYKDGTMNVFATVYRPATDIGEITRAPRSFPGPLVGLHKTELIKPALSVEKIEHISPAQISLPVAPPEDSQPFLVTRDPGIAAPAPEATSPPANENISLSGATSVSDAGIVISKDKKPEIMLLEAKDKQALPAEGRLTELQASNKKTVVPPSEQPANSKLTLPKEKHAENISDAISGRDLNEPEKTLPVEKSAGAKEVKSSQAFSPPFPQVRVPSSPGEPAVSARAAFQLPPYPSATAIPEQPNEYGDTLACDVALASRLIAEAELSKLSLADLIRKVIDLPRPVKDKILIPFALNNAEIKELAGRYQVPQANIGAIKDHILEDLQRFAGKKS